MNGVSVHIPLTHEQLGRLIGTRRPTVTLGLTVLVADGRARHEGNGRCLSAHESLTSLKPRTCGLRTAPRGPCSDGADLRRRR